MPAPTETDIDVVQGQTFTMQVTWADSQTSPPTPISLSGYHAHMQIRTKAGGVGNPLVDLTSIGNSPSLTIEPDESTGVVAVRIPATVTAALTKNCAYDLFVIADADSGQATRLVHGAVNVYKSVTTNA